VFYKLLTSLDPFFPHNVQYGEIDFIQPKDEEGTVYVKEKFAISDQDVVDLKTTIKDIWQKIQNIEFQKREKKDEECEKCTYCSMCWKINPHLS
jgi:sulfatase maturation enzyme AslB (radical SAM superfamily)